MIGAPNVADRKSRQSNIELLRILAASGVVWLHYNNASIGGGFGFAASGSVNEFIMVLFETLSICAVNVFVLISGYFLADNNKRDLLKPVELILQVLILGLVFFGISVLANGGGFNIDVFLSFFMSVNWFVFIYAALYIFSPYINLVWKSLDSAGKKRLLTLMLIVFSVYPTLLEVARAVSGRSMNGLSTVGATGSQSGYTIVIFVFMYLIGCSLRDMDKNGAAGASIELKTSKLLIWFCIDAVLIILWTYFDKLVLKKNVFETIAWNYDNPLVIIEAVLIFLIFRNMKIENTKVINTLSAASFTVYLVHVRFLPLCNIEFFASGSPVLLVISMLISAAGIYVAGFVIYIIYNICTKPLIVFLDNTWQKGRKYTA